MSQRDTDPELTALLSDLTGTLRELQEEVEPDRRPRLPTPETLSQFTSEVAIPGLILVLETNIRTLQLLRRAIRIADGRDPSTDGTVSDVRARAEQVGQTTLRQLEGSLDDLQSALEERPPDDEARQLLSRARQLHEEVTQQLDVERPDSADTEPEQGGDAGDSEADDGSEAVSIDVESELRTIKDNLDQDGDDDATGDGTTENGTGDDESSDMDEPTDSHDTNDGDNPDSGDAAGDGE